jgi:hypothetical protein
LLEPNNFFVEKYPVAMASCLVDIIHEVTNKVRLMNPFDHEVDIRQDTVLGEVEYLYLFLQQKIVLNHIILIM